MAERQCTNMPISFFTCISSSHFRMKAESADVHLRFKQDKKKHKKSSKHGDKEKKEKHHKDDKRSRKEAKRDRQDRSEAGTPSVAPEDGIAERRQREEYSPTAEMGKEARLNGGLSSR